MAEGEILTRLDEHMARGNEHMARGNEVMARIEVEFRKNREFETRMIGEQREFMRTTLLRIERVGRDEARQLSRLNDELERHGAERREQVAEALDESRAQRNALLKVLDRLDRLDPPPQAA